MLSMVPRKLKWLVETLGFVGNRAKGLKHIEKAAELPNIRGRFARICLLQLNTMFFENYTKAEELQASLLEDCPLFANFMGAILA